MFFICCHRLEVLNLSMTIEFLKFSPYILKIKKIIGIICYFLPEGLGNYYLYFEKVFKYT